MVTNMNENREVLTTAQVAALLGLSISTVTRLARSGELPARKLPGRPGAFIYDPIQVELWTLRQERKGKA